MSDRPWHSQPLTYIILFQLAILGYVSLGWGPSLGTMLYPRFGLFHIAGTLGLFLAAGLTLLVFLKAVFNFRFSQLNPVQMVVLLGLAALFFILGAERFTWGAPSIPVTGGVPAQPVRPFNLTALFTLFWVGYTLFLPLVARWVPLIGNLVEKVFPLPRIETGLLFAVNFGMAIFAYFMFQRFYTSPAIPFDPAVSQVHDGIAGILCMLIPLNILSEVDERVSLARARKILGARKRQVVVRPLASHSRPMAEAPSHVDPLGPTQPTTSHSQAETRRTGAHLE